MNRSLLLVICDFLILSLLALANFDIAGSDEPELAEEVVELENAAADQDLIEALKLSLEEERASRQELSGDLDLTQQALLDREETLAEREARLEALAADLERREAERLRLEQERLLLEEQVTETQAEVEVLAREREEQAEEARLARELALQKERELRENLAQLEQTRQNLAELEVRRREVEESNRQLSSQLDVSEAERRLIRENLDHVRQEVTLVRQEKDRLQEQSLELAQGVTTLAERSGELAQEVRRSQPMTSNTIFNEFRSNQVKAEFRRNRSMLLRERESETRSILVSDGVTVYALFHIENTGLSFGEAVDWEVLAGRVSAAGQGIPVRELSFLSIDPRIVVVEIPGSMAENFGTKIYQLAQDPFRFSEAVLINSGGGYYGESSFTLNADHRSYVRMPSRLTSRLFGGEFSPSRGDLVFSKADELIGIMVNDEYCALIDNFFPAATLELGNNLTGTGRILIRMKSRVDLLPRRIGM